MKTKSRLNLNLILGLIIVGISLTLAFAGPSLAPRNPLEETRVMEVDGVWISAPFPPFKFPEYPLGTDGNGRDVLSQVLWALRPTLLLTGYVAFLRLLIGTTVGLLAGWNNNRFGNFLSGVISAALSIPTLLVALAVVALTGDIWQPWGFVLGLSLTGWADSARLVREQTHIAREQLFIEASRALGQGNWTIVFKHILRLVLPFVWMLLALEISSTILLTAGLGFLGYYVGGEVWIWISDTTATRLRGMPELGQLLSGVNEDIYVSPWKLFASGTFVFITVLGFNLLGEGLRRFANSGAPSPRLFDLSLRLRWQLDETLSPVKKWARSHPLAAFAISVLLVLALSGVIRQVRMLTEAQPVQVQTPGGHLWSGQYGAPTGTLWVNAPGVTSPIVEWTFSDAQGFAGAPAVAVDGSVYILSKAGTLYCLNPDGTVQWATSIPAGGVGTPGLDAQGNVYVTDLLGGLTSFTPTGEQRWRLEVPDSLEATSGPVIGNNNIVYYVVIGNVRAASSDGELLWDTQAFTRRVPFVPVLDKDERFVFLRNTIINAQTGDVLVFDSLPNAEQYVVGQSGLLYSRFEAKVTGWEYFNENAEPRSYVAWARTGFFGFPNLMGVFADGSMWLHYAGEGAEDTTLVWMDKKGNQINNAQFAYRPSVIGGMDEDNVFYVCGSAKDHLECAAVEQGAKEPIWTLPLEGSQSISGAALIPTRLYAASDEGMLYAIGNK